MTTEDVINLDYTKEENQEKIAKNTQENMKSVDIYTDGACSGNPGPGGYGVVVICIINAVLSFALVKENEIIPQQIPSENSTEV